MTAWDTVVDDLRREQLDKTYRTTPDPLMQVIGILAGLLATGRKKAA